MEHISLYLMLIVEDKLKTKEEGVYIQDNYKLTFSNQLGKQSGRNIYLV